MVSHNGIPHTFDFAPKSGEKNIFQWAAFYGYIILHFCLFHLSFPHFSILLMLEFF